MLPPRLPLEVWDRAIDHLWNDRAALEACSLTCHAWFSCTRVHVFRNAQVHLHCEQDCDTLANLTAPYTAHPLRLLSIVNLGRTASFHAEADAATQARWLDDKLPPLLPELFRAETLHLFNVIWATGIPRGLEGNPWYDWLRLYLAMPPKARASVRTLSPRIRTLVLQTVWFEGRRMFQEFLDDFTGMVKLDLQDITITESESTMRRAPSLLDFTKLKRLSVVQLRVASILRKEGALGVLSSKFSPEVRELRIMFCDLAQGSLGDDLTAVQIQWQLWDEAIATLHRLNPHVLIRLMLECVEFGSVGESREDLATSMAKYDTCLEGLTQELGAYLRQSVDSGARVVITCTPPKEMPFKAFWLTADGPQPCLEGPIEDVAERVY
ncbi:uncharacterized protein C8Q71DRAFT_855702 [Rhodofomes roseus]|uniref:F-box domain-containing protein n=1 Tax=Rhodofomes roseus TaxID=34475 RepID=A0ABQ8KLY1_9APHY|nr:uncharacterized protein C8Q71DRAFT_855702 [Rhodofomes roseus]KAH9839053.1 hypothetical protein C8Q71DRAFT_855702 [Rhodofomes roseus]